MAKLGTVVVDVQYDAKAAAQALQRDVQASANAAADGMNSTFESAALKMGTQFTRVGRQISFGISLPLAAVGKQAESAFTGYETSITKVGALTNTSASQLAYYQSQLGSFASQFGIDAQKAADGLFYIVSGGLQGQQAMDALRISAEASAVGLGDVDQIAKLTTSVIAAYGSQNITAAQAMDAVVAATKSGKVAATDLATAMGPVIPIASQLGVSFQDLAGAFAAMSQTGTNADQAATQLRQIFVSLEKPSSQAQAALRSVGLSAEQLQSDVKNKGLLGTMRELTGAFGDNEEAINAVFGNVRALNGVFELTNDRSNTVQQAFDAQADAAGGLDKAFAMTSQTAEFKLNTALAGIHNSMIEVGSDVAPIVQDFAELGAKGAAAFADLPAPVKQTAVGIGAVLVAAGPLLYSFGAFASLAGKLGGAVGRLGPIFADGADYVRLYGEAMRGDATAQELFLSMEVPAALPLVSVLAGALIVFSKYQSVVGDAQAATDAFFADLDKKSDEKKGAGAFDDLLGKVDNANKLIAAAQQDYLDATGKVAGGNALVDNPAQQIIAGNNADAARKDGEAAVQMVKNANAIADAYGVSKDQAASWVKEQDQAGQRFDNSKDAADAYGKSLGHVNATTSQAVTATGQLVDQSKTLSDTFNKYLSANNGLVDAQQKAADSAEAVGKAQRDVVAAQHDAQQATDGIAQAQANLVKAHRSVIEAEANRVKSIQKVSDAIQAQRDAEQNLIDVTSGETAQNNQLAIQDAQLALKRAQDKVAGYDDSKDAGLQQQQNQLDLAHAQLALQQAQEAPAKAQRDAQGQLKSAIQGVADARDGEQQATQGVADAQDAERQATKQVADARYQAAQAQQKVADAQENVNKAIRDQKKAQEDLLPSAEAAAQAQSDLANALGGANSEAPAYINFLKQLEAEYPSLKTVIEGVLGQFQAAQIRSAYNGSNWLINRAVGKQSAYGNYLDAGEPSSVVENGAPELWQANGKTYLIPPTGGQVVPLDKIRPPAGPQSGGVHVAEGAIQIFEQSSPRSTGIEVSRQLKKKSWLGGGGR